MEKKQAISIIENTLGNKFNENNFTKFIINLLNDVEPRKNQYSGQMLWDDYKEHINSYKRIGKYTDPDGESLDILIVKVKTVKKLERTRTALRNFVIKHLKKFGDKDYALVAFYSGEDEGADWRFSFIKLEYQSYFDEERVRIREEFTPAKRYSFLVGENEQSHTAKNQILPILTNTSNNPTIEDIENAFSIEKVTSEFFNQYKDLYIKLFEHFKNDTHIVAALNKATIDNARFTKKLLGQIVFLYFLQKKGWLGVLENENWGKGDKRFIQNLFAKSKEQNQNFFKDRLQYLFYEALAEERNNKNSFYERFNCRIPFLNGGLFEAEYNWQDANITIPENLFRNKEKNKAGDVGTGVLDVFDRYNFTIKEDEPLDKEVAVDPEMLGKVFENMLEVTERKSKGAFYTPREIVHYMCQESLIHYLENALEGKVPKTDIETYIRKGQNALENDQRVANMGKETSIYKYELPEIIRENANLIDQKLTQIKICDPAIGSGAFPVGLLHELVNAQLVIKSHLKGNYLAEKLEGFGLKKNENISQNRYVYRLKRHIIQESIYGVDIDASAIDIARLRLWLSLVVDEDDFDPIETLPNLDYKIVCGNSLISRYDLDMPIDNVFKDFNKKVKNKDYNNPDIKNLVGDEDINLAFYKKLTNDFLLESSHKKKDLFRELIKEIKNAFKTSLNKRETEKISKARGEVENLQQSNIFGKRIGTKTEIKNAKNKLAKLEKEKQETEEGVLFKNATEWRFEFPNLLDDNGVFIGFDIVIGNPPYGAEIDEFTNIFEKMYSKTTKFFKDIYKIFYELSISHLLKERGVVSFITPNTFLLQPRYEDLRIFMLSNELLSIVNLGENIFDAVVPTAISVIKKGVAHLDNSLTYVDISTESNFIGKIKSDNSQVLYQYDFSKNSDHSFIKPHKKYENTIELDQILNFKDAGINYQRINVGLKEKGKSDLSFRLLYEGEKNNKEDFMYWKGTDIYSYFIKPLTNRFVNVSTIKNLAPNERVVLNKDYFSISPKLIWRQTASYPIVTLDTSGVWFGRSIQAGTIKEKETLNYDYRYILSLLNSSLIRDIYLKKVQEVGRVFPQVKLQKLKTIPIKKISIEQQKPFIYLVDQILAITKQENYDPKNPPSEQKDIKAKIDEMVFELYNLTDDEIKIIEDKK